MKNLSLKKVMAGAMAVSVLMTGTACSSNGGEQNSGASEPAATISQESVPTDNAQVNDQTQNQANNDQNMNQAENMSGESQTAPSGSLPGYEYPGPEQFYYAVYQYVTEELGQYYDSADVCIPSISIIDEDDHDPNDIQVWGFFEVYNYTLDGQTLVTENGGSHPGLLHVKATEGGYEVTGLDEVASGTDNDESAKKIFGNRYNAFQKLNSNPDERNKVRAQIIANYVAANSLDITQYQDFGWDPVALPAENIDSFYSALD